MRCEKDWVRDERILGLEKGLRIGSDDLEMA